mgnify:CR=1 FL=1
MGSDSDLPVVAPAIKQLRELSIETEVHVMSAHRTPKEAMAFAESARENGFGVILAAAGMAAHLGGVLAASTTLPVIGIPCSAKVLDGMDAHAGYGDDAPGYSRWLPLGSMRLRTQRCWPRRSWLWAMTT